MARQWDGGQWKMRVSAASDDDSARLWAALGKRFAQPPLVGQRIETLHLRNGDPEQKRETSTFSLLFGSAPGMEKKSRSGMNIPDYFFEKQFLGLKILKFFDTDPDSVSWIFLTRDRDGKIGIRDKTSRISNTVFAYPSGSIGKNKKWL
jgi:hypothetical protein